MWSEFLLRGHSISGHWTTYGGGHPAHTLITSQSKWHCQWSHPQGASLPGSGRDNIRVIPTLVGVNQAVRRCCCQPLGFSPHTVGVNRCRSCPLVKPLQVIPTHSGGWPSLFQIGIESAVVFPTQVGVNRMMMGGSNSAPHRRLFALQALSGWGQYPHTPIPIHRPSRAK
jgi:hypothetical protein